MNRWQSFLRAPIDNLFSRLALGLLLVNLIMTGPAVGAGATGNGELPAEGTVEAGGETGAAEPVAQQTEEEKRQAAESTVRLLGKIFGAIASEGQGDEEEEESHLHLVGQTAPKLSLQSVDGEPLRLEDLRGKVVVLDFWATWCGPCVAAMPEIEKVHTHFAGKDVVVIGVNQQEDLETVKTFLSHRGTTFSQVLDADNKAGTAFAVTAIPQTVLIDKQGIVQEVHTGFTPDLRQNLISNVDKLLRGENLFDEQQIADARRKREEKLKAIAEQVAIYQPERLERLDDVIPQPDSALASGYNLPQWVTLPGESEPSLAIVPTQKKLAILRTGQEPKTIEIDWKDEIAMWNFAPVRAGDQLHWAVLGAEYDEEYDIKQFTLACVDMEGKTLWTNVYPALDIDSYPAVDLTAANLTGDGDSEIVLVVKHDGLEGGMTGPDGASRVLTVFNAGGERILRSWLPSGGDESVVVVPESDGAKLLISTSEGITRFRVKP